MKKIIVAFFVFLSAGIIFAQSEDDLFFDDGIESVDDVSAKTSLSKGTLFETGSIKIGGNFTTSLETLTTLYSSENNSFSTNFSNTTISPKLNALLTVDARPTETLRMYAKFGMNYPFETTAAGFYNSTSTAEPTVIDGTIVMAQPVNTTITDWLYLKELFTDFSIKDSVFFRFGLHTVTWGAGYFFSPVSDIINKSFINPEDVDAQVDGALNLRAQIVFPSSQNCIWLYVIPSDDFSDSQQYLKNTAIAGKVDLVFGNWEVGLGGYYKYQNAPKAMITATGSLGKVNVFGEAVYSYGTQAQWAQDLEDKSNVIQATVGASYFWKNPSITVAGQYYYNGTDYSIKTLNDINYVSDFFYKGQNIALMANFGRIFGTTDVTATIFGMVNFGRGDLCEKTSPIYPFTQEISSYITSGICSAMIYYSPISDLKFGIGPYMTITDFESKPTVSLKLSCNLGGGKF